MPSETNHKMRKSCDQGRATTTTTITSSTVEAAPCQGSKSNHIIMVHSDYNYNPFHDESCDFSDDSVRPSSESSPAPSFHLRNSKNSHNYQDQTSSLQQRSIWSKMRNVNEMHFRQNGLIGSIHCEEGHIYSIAATGDMVYTGSDSKNIRVWKNLKEFSGFKSSSGLVKAIVLSGEKVFTGHQDGKIRVWRASPKDPIIYKRAGSLPNFKDFVKKSFNPKNYVEVRRHRNVLRIKHFDAVSCLSLNKEQGLLYSGSWDRTLKVWRVSDSKCLESVNAHDDAVNAVVADFDTLVFTGSADGTVKVWRRDFAMVNGKKSVTHSLQQVLLKQENAVTALAANVAEGVLYCGDSDGLVYFWECGKQLSHGGVLRGHKLAVLCLEAAGSMVFSGGADKNICVWKRGDGGAHTCLSVLSGHTGPVKCLAVQEDEESSNNKEDKRWVVYSGSLDKSVKVWRVSEQSPDFRKLHLI